MRQLARLIARFKSDERGMFAVIFGVMAIVLVATAGAVVDFVTLQQARNRAQVALDAAALALQPRIFEDDYEEEDIRLQAEALVQERIADDRIVAGVDVIDTNPDDGSLYLEAFLDVPTYFVELVGVPQLSARLASEATRKKLALEVVMVLDNSGSMDREDRMDHLHDAATCATNILFFETCYPAVGAVPADNVKVGLVPFTTMVNVGPQYADAAWMDRDGLASKSNDNFDNDDNEDSAYPGGADRIGLFDSLTNVDWKGCMEARAYPYSVNDEEPTTGDPTTLFSPAFAPDEPDSGYRNDYLPDDPAACRRSASCTCTYTTQRQCNRWGNNCSNVTTRSCSLAFSNGTTASGSNVCTCGNYTSGTYTCSVTTSILPYLSNRERQERLCKYTGAADIDSYLEGPNAGCLDAQILPLSTSPGEVRDEIEDMRAEGGTNIHSGTIWGFHALTPTEPLVEAAPFGEATSKVMIVMTDGENTFYTENNMNRAQFNQFYGFPYNRREGDMSSTNRSMARRMDVLLAETCENAKDAGITIYTIGLATDEVVENTPEAVRELLTDCASGPEFAFFPEEPDDLIDTFASIAEQLAQLRLAQ
jgi:hypothetical protein